MKKMPIALTIAGSDSGGGAGIQADLKTFACLGVHGASAITSITAQNTLGVQGTYTLPAKVVQDQIEVILADMRVGCAKTGMLSSSQIIRTVVSALKKYDFPLVVDPVMEAEAGGKLLEDEAIPTMVEELFPLATVVTPNIFEAEKLTDIKIKSLRDAREAALMLNSLGAKNVIITGGHLDFTDVLYDGEIMLIEGKQVEGGTHGAGCTYSAAITAELSKGKSLREAAVIAKRFLEQAISQSFGVGEGIGPVNQLAGLSQDAERYRVLKNVEEGLVLLEKSETFSRLIPEVGCNLGMAIPGAKSIEDIAAVSGRIVPLKGRAHAVGCVAFGASSHVARIILAAMSYDKERRGAINIRYSKEILAICEDMGLKVASFSRLEEPENTSTLDWGIRKAIERTGGIPDVVYDLGEVGKEPMIRLFALGALEVAERAIKISEMISL